MMIFCEWDGVGEPPICECEYLPLLLLLSLFASVMVFVGQEISLSLGHLTAISTSFPSPPSSSYYVLPLQLYGIIVLRQVKLSPYMVFYRYYLYYLMKMYEQRKKEQ